MEITFCHIIGLVVAYTGLSAIFKRETFISPPEEEVTEYNKTYIRGIWAILLGILLVGLSIHILFFETECAPVSAFFK